MFKIYEVRNKHTHQILYLNLFEEGEKPDDQFRANPDSESFAGRKDLYLSTREETYPDKDKAWSECMKLFVQYKLMPKERLEENIKSPKTAKPKAKSSKASQPKSK